MPRDDDPRPDVRAGRPSGDLVGSISSKWRGPATGWGRQAGGAPMRLVARAADDAVSIALIDHGGRELFAERSPWNEYDRAFFDRCLARARVMAGHCQLAVSVGSPMPSAAW